MEDDEEEDPIEQQIPVGARESAESTYLKCQTLIHRLYKRAYE